MSTVNVTTVGNNCTWTAVSNDPFITITVGASGSGNGTVTYSVAANNTASLRTGTMTIAGQIFTVFEAPTSCVQAISPTSNTSVPAIGALSLSVSVTALLNCNWTAVSLDNFITVTSGPGSGSSKVKYSVAANPNSTPRTGFLIIGNKAFLVFQAGQ